MKKIQYLNIHNNSLCFVNKKKLTQRNIKLKILYGGQIEGVNLKGAWEKKVEQGLQKKILCLNVRKKIRIQDLTIQNLKF